MVSNKKDTEMEKIKLLRSIDKNLKSLNTKIDKAVSKFNEKAGAMGMPNFMDIFKGLGDMGMGPPPSADEMEECEECSSEGSEEDFMAAMNDVLHPTFPDPKPE